MGTGKGRERKGEDAGENEERGYGCRSCEWRIRRVREGRMKSKEWVEDSKGDERLAWREIKREERGVWKRVGRELGRKGEVNKERGRKSRRKGGGKLMGLGTERGKWERLIKRRREVGRNDEVR